MLKINMRTPAKFLTLTHENVDPPTNKAVLLVLHSAKSQLGVPPLAQC